ncbi:alpha/beta hydrolase family protein [Pseudemcibacter aquimaris]|uniref:alpha/beta hydrolase family protein n=1 Tax=Pseudemcibacter aquimaris TaxID=2857064 RepID=UPI0020115EB8|nr:S9 family peptidase [Pseudemcibacter aquimaris]MCC3859623.1 S9 family peptidase [Pseudemcibacter aquimaris]WDU60018.1 S9 family peptidase [Pseudemcibacter aquimaris]
MKKVFLSFVFLSLTLINSSQAQDEIAQLAQAFGKLPEIKDIDISPDGTKLLMLQNYQGRTILVTRSLTEPNAQPNGIPPFENQEFTWTRWASDDRILAGIRFPYTNRNVFIGSYGTYETRLISMDWTGENPVNPVRINPDRSRQSQIQDNIIDILEDDPEHVLMQLDYDEQYVPYVYKVNIMDTSKPTRVVRGRDIIDFWETDSNNVVRYGEGTSDRQGSSAMRHVAWYRKSEDSGWETVFDLNMIEERAPFQFEGFSQDPSIIYVTANDENNRSAAYTYNVDTKEFVEKIASVEGYDISSVYVNEKDELEFFTYYDIQPRIHYFDEEKQKLLELLKKTFPGTSINFHGESKDENIVVFETTSPTEPGTFYLFNKSERKMEMLGYNYTEVNVEQLSEMQPITYQARDGLTIPGYLSLPKGGESKNLPTVIMPHGGPLARDNWGFDYWVQFLTAQGYAVLQMNFRGSTGYGDDYREMGRHQWAGKMIHDINDGAKWMVEQGYANPDRMCIVGGSYGGYAALQAIVDDQSIYKCSVAFAPVTNLENRVRYYNDFGDTNDYIDYMRSNDYTLDEASPSKNVDKINVPVLLVHGVDDRSVRVSQSQFFYENMKSRDKDIKYIEWEDGDHFLSQQKHRVEFLEEMGRFLKEHL